MTCPSCKNEELSRLTAEVLYCCNCGSVRVETGGATHLLVPVVSQSAVTVELLGLIRSLAWECTDRYQAAEASMKAAHDAGTAYPHTEQEMRQFKIDMLRSKIELEKADNAEPVQSE